MLPNTHRMSEPKLYTVDENGMPKEEIKIIREPIFAINVPEGPQYVTPPDFSFTCECTPEFSEEFLKILEEHDREILEEYSRLMRAFECCVQDVRNCRACPLQDDDSCRGHLLHNVMKILINHKELHRQMMLGSRIGEGK